MTEEQLELERSVKELYERVHQRWAIERHNLKTGECGFSVLGGPPILQPSLLILGENPGFNAEDQRLGQAHVETSWPEISNLCDPKCDWKMLTVLRQLLKAAGYSSEALQNIVMSNFLFFKSPSMRDWWSNEWACVERLEAFCKQEVASLISILKPKRIMVLGLRVFDQHAQGNNAVLNDANGRRRLLLTGKIHGVESFAIMHPTGSHVASADWDRVSEWMKENLSL
jgi:hypothetical protein